MVSRRLLPTLVVLVFASDRTATAQLPSVVQLPSFQTFSYSGTVVVPDRGSIYLGGVRRSASGYTSRGLRRGAGQVQGTSGATLRSVIIAHDEIDRQVLGVTPRQFIEGQQASVEPASADRTEAGKSLVRFARRRYRAGDKSGAYYAYQLAVEKLEGRLRDLAIAEWRRVFPKSF